MFAISCTRKVLIKRKSFEDTTQINCEILIFKNDKEKPKLQETYTFYNVLDAQTPLEWGRSSDAEG